MMYWFCLLSTRFYSFFSTAAAHLLFLLFLPPSASISLGVLNRIRVCNRQRKRRTVSHCLFYGKETFFLPLFAQSLTTFHGKIKERPQRREKEPHRFLFLSFAWMKDHGASNEEKRVIFRRSLFSPPSHFFVRPFPKDLL